MDADKIKTFEDELEAIKTIYQNLKPFESQERDRILRMVGERLNREGQKVRPLDPKRVAAEHLDKMVKEFGEPFDFRDDRQ